MIGSRNRIASVPPSIVLPVLLSLLLFATQACSAEDDSAGDPWLALVVPTGMDANEQPVGILRAVNTETAAERDFGGEAYWYAPRWSPGGRYLFAMSIQNPVRSQTEMITLNIFERESGKATASVDWPAADCPENPFDARWAPDGSRIAVPATGCSVVLEVDGALHVRPIARAGQSLPLVGIAWSEDSSRFSMVGFGDTPILVLADRDGEPVGSDGYVLPDPPADDAEWSVTKISWSADDSVELSLAAIRPPADDEDERYADYIDFTATLDGSDVSWSAPRSADDPNEAAIERRDHLIANHGLGDVVLQTYFTRDLAFVGGIPLVQIASQPKPTELQFVTFIEDERYVYSMGAPSDAAFFFQGRFQFDIARAQ